MWLRAVMSLDPHCNVRGAPVWEGSDLTRVLFVSPLLYRISLGNKGCIIIPVECVVLKMERKYNLWDSFRSGTTYWVFSITLVFFGFLVSCGVPHSNLGAIICLPSHSVIPKSRLLTWASSASHQHPQDHPARLLTSPSYSHTGRHSRSSTGSCPCDFLPPRLVFLPSPSSYFSKFLWCAHFSWPHSGLQFHVSPSPPRSLHPPPQLCPSSRALCHLLRSRNTNQTGAPFQNCWQRSSASLYVVSGAHFFRLHLNRFEI